MANVNFQTAYTGYSFPGNYSNQGSVNAAENAGKPGTTAAGFGVSDPEASEKGKGLQFGGCETCRNRKYVDGSNESDVSFKTPGHISPGASAFVVAGHEREHVANAVQKGSQPGAKLVSATVRLQTAVCPECGRRYVSGGVTKTLIKYDQNPYSQMQNSINGSLLKGNNVDLRL